MAILLAGWLVGWLQGELPPLEVAVASMRAQLDVLTRERAGQEVARGKLQAEVEALVGRVAQEKNLVSC